MTDDDRRQARLDDLVAGEAESGPDDGDTDAGVARDEGAGTTSSGAGPGDSRSAGVTGSPTGAAEAPGSDAGVAETVELGVALLAHLEDGELTLAEAVDRIETVTTDPALTREILDTAEMRGLLDRADGLVRPSSGAFVRFERDVVSREGEFTCRRCGASLSTGYFIRFDAGEHGPFGSSCVRKVTGRE